MVVPCPKCGRELSPSGVVTDEAGAERHAYQCPECLRTVEFLGERTEVALTFVVDDQGRPFDPAEPDADLSA